MLARNEVTRYATRCLCPARLPCLTRFRTPLALEMDYPEPRPVEAEAGEVIAVPEVRGRHHHDERHAA